MAAATVPILQYFVSVYPTGSDSNNDRNHKSGNSHSNHNVTETGTAMTVIATNEAFSMMISIPQDYVG